MKRMICFLVFLVMAAVPFSLHAASYDIKYMTPAVEQAIKSRQARYDDIQALKSRGALGENRSGYLEARDGSASAAGLAAAENKDRKVIYTAIVEQNDLAPAALAQVEETFAAVQRERAAPGEAVQLPDGRWVNK